MERRRVGAARLSEFYVYRLGIGRARRLSAVFKGQADPCFPVESSEFSS
jgi:hypothetical protein